MGVGGSGCGDQQRYSPASFSRWRRAKASCSTRRRRKSTSTVRTTPTVNSPRRASVRTAVTSVCGTAVHRDAARSARRRRTRDRLRRRRTDGNVRSGRRRRRERRRGADRRSRRRSERVSLSALAGDRARPRRREGREHLLPLRDGGRDPDLAIDRPPSVDARRARCSRRVSRSGRQRRSRAPSPLGPRRVLLRRTWHVYYAISTFGAKRSAIGVATNPTLDPRDPRHRWTDHGVVVESSDTTDYNAIDPNVVIDGGRPWLTWGSFWSGIKLAAIDPGVGEARRTDATHRVTARPDVGHRSAVHRPARRLLLSVRVVRLLLPRIGEHVQRACRTGGVDRRPVCRRPRCSHAPRRRTSRPRRSGGTTGAGSQRRPPGREDVASRLPLLRRVSRGDGVARHPSYPLDG